MLNQENATIQIKAIKISALRSAIETGELKIIWWQLQNQMSPGKKAAYAYTDHLVQHALKQSEQ